MCWKIKRFVIEQKNYKLFSVLNNNIGVVDVLARQKQEIKDKLARDIVERDIEGKNS